MIGRNSLRPIRGSSIARALLRTSYDAFNKASGLLLVAPITQGDIASRETGFSITLMGAGTRTQGIVLCDQTRTIDARARIFKRVEKAPAALIEEALDAVRSVLE